MSSLVVLKNQQPHFVDQLEVTTGNVTGVGRYFTLGDFLFLNAETLNGDLTALPETFCIRPSFISSVPTVKVKPRLNYMVKPRDFGPFETISRRFLRQYRVITKFNNVQW